MVEVPSNGSRNPGPTVPREERLLDALGDPVVRRILASIDGEARTAPELSQATGVPLTTLYRKLHELEESDLVGIERSAITPDGKRVDFYRSRVEELHLELRTGRFSVKTRYRNLAAVRMEGLWGAVREEVRR
jgi:DNA-binding transcriptional ArsR family regulator